MYLNVLFPLKSSFCLFTRKIQHPEYAEISSQIADENLCPSVCGIQSYDSITHWYKFLNYSHLSSLKYRYLCSDDSAIVCMEYSLLLALFSCFTSLPFSFLQLLKQTIFFSWWELYFYSYIFSYAPAYMLQTRNWGNQLCQVQSPILLKQSWRIAGITSRKRVGGCPLSMHY